MSTDITVVDKDPTEEEKYFNRIRLQYRIPEERFELGKEFATQIAEGALSANKIYELVFKVPQETARKKSAKLKHAKWVQELIRYYKYDDSVEYIKEQKDILKVFYKIATDDFASNRERTDAGKAYMEATQKEQALKDKDGETEVNDAVQLIGRVMKGIQAVQDIDKMIGQGGEVIDVPVLE